MVPRSGTAFKHCALSLCREEIPLAERAGITRSVMTTMAISSIHFSFVVYPISPTKLRDTRVSYIFPPMVRHETHSPRTRFPRRCHNHTQRSRLARVAWTNGAGPLRREEPPAQVERREESREREVEGGAERRRE